MNCDIVIAHYKENIDWLSKLNPSNIRHILVYSKEQYNLRSDLNDKIIHTHLPNTGRESSTYLRYCIDYYDNLADFVIFLQANPCEHRVCSPTILKWLEIIDKDNNYKFTKNYIVSSVYSHLKDGRRDAWKGKTEPSQYSMKEWWSVYINRDINQNKANIYFGANFGVHRTGITSRPKQLYEDLITKELNSINPEACHYLERAWFYLFNMDLL